MRIRQLFISPGHNYFGHAGRPPGSHPMVEAERIECVAGRGIAGDRFFDYRENYKGQITFFAAEVHEALGRELGIGNRDVSVFRRNLVTAGVDLNDLIGVEFEVQGVRFLGTEACKPCFWMDQAFGPGAEEFLKPRGGLRAVILSSGVLRKDSP